MDEIAATKLWCGDAPDRQEDAIAGLAGMLGQAVRGKIISWAAVAFRSDGSYTIHGVPRCVVLDYLEGAVREAKADRLRHLGLREVVQFIPRAQPDGAADGEPE